MNRSSRAYALAGRFLAQHFLAIPAVLSIYARRSVAAGEASFPWSDLDLEIIVDDTRPSTLLNLLRRFQAARLCFPRLGETFVITPEEALAKAKLDPYRASLDRRAAILLYGEAIPIPLLPIPPTEAARRLIFWYENFIPRSVQTGNRRNQRKFLLEIRNAFGVLNGDWPEPLLTRHETQARTGALPVDPIAECDQLAQQAARILGYSSPQALLIHIQNPFLWTQDLNIPRPSAAAFHQAARRYLSPERLRGPCFLGESIQAPALRLAKVQKALQSMEPLATSTAKTLHDYYSNEYPRLNELRNHLTQILSPVA